MKSRLRSNPAEFSLAHASGGPVLFGAVVDIDLVVAVGVIDGRHQKHHLVQKPSQIPNRDISHQMQHGLFSLDLSGMDVCHDKDNGLAAGGRIERRRHGRL
jgi:hypothetical protein